jgi:S1-C subfamily serine protease
VRAKLLFLLFLAVSVFWIRQPVPEAPVPPGPDTSMMVRVFTQAGMGHACPVSTNLAITNAHVIDGDGSPEDAATTPVGGRYQSLRGMDGTFATISVSPVSDLAIILTNRADPPLSYYSLAKTPPKIGERLWWVAYDWNRQRAFSPKLLSGVVKQVIAGHIIIDAKTPEGSSGGCMLNRQGEVVGITTFGIEFSDDEGGVAGAVGLWGKWFNLPELTKAVEGARAK